MALLTVMVLMGIMLTTALALISRVDTQTSASQAERVRDSAFNLAESALNAQIFSLARSWPGPGAAGVPALQYPACAPTTVSNLCPVHGALIQGGSSDLTGATWTTTVRDNGPDQNAVESPDFYSDTLSQGQPAYDRNNDGRVWVRAQAIAQGRTRTLVALVRSESQEEDVPHAALIAGKLDISNNGNKEIIRSNNGQVAVRCNQPQNQNVGKCLGHELQGSNGTFQKLMANLAGQVSGATPTMNYAGGPAMTTEARLRLRATAISNGSYYTSCPTAAQLNAKLVYIESGTCKYTSNTIWNSAKKPGAVVIGSGSIEFGGTSIYYGVVYNANLTNSATDAVETQGNAKIVGGVLIDGGATMVAGSSGLNIEFDLNAYRAVSSYGSAGVIQNTWREIRAG